MGYCYFSLFLFYLTEVVHLHSNYQNYIYYTIEAVLNTTMLRKHKTKQSLIDKERDNLQNGGDFGVALMSKV